MTSAAMIMRDVLKEAGAKDPRNLAHDLIEKLDAERLIIVARPMALDSNITRSEQVPAALSEQQLLILDTIEGNVYAWVQEAHILAKTIVHTERTGDITALEAYGLIECRRGGVRECRMRDAGYACLAAARKAGWEGRAKFVFRRQTPAARR